jgi:uncharacterized C2H2 Zn-finger protein/antitoxin component of MazEF toxin-antitoxin module
MLRKIKQEPLEIADVGPSLLANAKSAYRNGIHSGEENSTYDSSKRKSSDYEYYGRKRGRFNSLGVDLYSQNGLSDVLPGNSDSVGEKSYDCSLCEEKFSNDEDRMCHITLVHKSKSNTGRRNSTRFARHTCQICFARFRTLKDFFSHTNCHGESAGLSAIQKSINESIANNNIQRFFTSSLGSSSVSDIFQAAFKCDCCDRIFSNRDSYAMHVMMRVKNDTCKQQHDLHKGDKEQWRKLTETEGANLKKQPKDENPSPKSDILTADLNKASYVDVTNATDKDEYLQSLLEHSVERLCSQNMSLLLKDPRKCILCNKMFADKDSLAMHVMSHHNDGLSSFTQSQNRHANDKANSVAMRMPTSFVRLLQSSKEDAIQTKVENKKLWCEYCKIEFVDHDSLAMHILNHTLSEVNEKQKKEHSSITADNRRITYWDSKPANYTKELSETPLNLVTSRESLVPTVRVVRVQQNDKNEDTDYLKREKDTQKNQDTTDKVEMLPKITLSMQRSASVPDMRDILKEVPHRPASVEGGEKSYEYLLTDTPLDGFSDEKLSEDSPSDLKKPQDAVKPRGDEIPPSDLNEAKKQMFVATDEFSNPHELLKHIDKPVYFCRFCEVIFLNRTMFYLHKGLHNVNNPWQCNMCGQMYTNVHDFSAHIIHP